MPITLSMNEIARIVNAAIDMRFRGEVNDRIKLVLGHQRIHLVGIGNIGFEKFIAIAVFLDHAVEIGEVAGIREHVDVTDQRRFVVLEDVTNEIAAYESAAARYQNSHSGR